jgi:uncharacterized protein (TIGR03083 family)
VTAATPAWVYRDTRERLTELVGGLDDTAAETNVPSTPAWTVKDVIGHLSGLVTDWLNGRTEDYGGQAWTAQQVAVRRQWSLKEVLDEWNEASPKLEALMDDPRGAGFPDHMPYLAAADLVVHEHDIRGAVGRPGARDSEGVRLAMKTYVTGVRQRHDVTELGPMVIRESDGREWPVGKGEPVISVTAPRFELFRAISGRRSRDQARSFAWDAEPGPHLDLLLLSGFAWAEEDLDH